MAAHFPVLTSYSPPLFLLHHSFQYLTNIIKFTTINTATMSYRRLAIITPFLFVIIAAPAQTKNLGYYLEQGLIHSPLLRDYNNQILSARFDSLLVNASFGPQVALNTNIAYAPSGKSWGYSDAATNGGTYQSIVAVNQPLLIHRQRKNQVEAIELLKQTIGLNAKLSTIDLQKSITAQYLTTFADFSLYQFNKKVGAQLKKELQTLKELVEKGIYLQTDFYNLDIAIRSIEVSNRQTFIQMKNNIGILNLLCGITDTCTTELQTPLLSVPSLGNNGSSVQMQLFTTDSLRNINLQKSLDNAYLPKLSIYADAGFNSILPKEIPYNFGTSIGLTLSLPIYDGRQRQHQHQKIYLAESTRSGYQEMYLKQYKQQELQLAEQLRLSINLSSTIREQLKKQEELIQLYRKEISHGLVRFLDYITVLNGYLTAQSALIQAENNRLQIIMQMIYLK